MSSLDAEEIRTMILKRQEFSEEVERIFQDIPYMDVRVFRVRCDKNPQSRPLMAKAWEIGGGRYFVRSKIEWLSLDALRMQPWDAELLLGIRAEPDWLNDDDLVLSTYEQVQLWQSGQLPYGGKWLRRVTEPTFINTVLEQGKPPIITPWMRCREHPGGAEVLTYEQLLLAGR